MGGSILEEVGRILLFEGVLFGVSPLSIGSTHQTQGDLLGHPHFGLLIFHLHSLVLLLLFNNYFILVHEVNSGRNIDVLLFTSGHLQISHDSTLDVANRDVDVLGRCQHHIAMSCDN